MEYQVLLVLATLLIMGWFALGVIINLRRGSSLVKWMQGGLPQVGERTSFRWLGSSVAQMVIEKPKKPFKRFETMIVLAPRDVPWMWVWSHWRGRQDTLVIRTQLAKPTSLDFEWADPGSWTGRTSLQQATEQSWAEKPYEGLPLMAPGIYLEKACTLMNELKPSMQQVSGRYWRFSVRREGSQLEFHIPFPNQNTVEARTFFDAIQQLAQSVSR